MDERAKKIFEETYATIDRINNMPMREPVEDDYVPIKQFTPVVRRERGLDTMRQEEKEQVDWSAWDHWADAKISVAINQFCEVYSDQIIDLVFTRIKKAGDAAHTEIEQLKAQVSELRGEVNLLRELLKGNVKDISHAIRKDIA